MSNRYVRVAAKSDVPEGAVISVDVGGVQVALCNVGGEFFAVHDECTHECYPLSEGTLEDGAIVCMLHGARFDLRTGGVLAPPAYEPVEIYEVRIDGEDILIGKRG